MSFHGNDATLSAGRYSIVSPKACAWRGHVKDSQGNDATFVLVSVVNFAVISGGSLARTDVGNFANAEGGKLAIVQANV